MLNQSNGVVVTAPISMPGWVGTTSDLTRLVDLFRDLEQELRETVSVQLDKTEKKREVEEEARFDYVAEDRRSQRVKESLQEHRQKALDGITLKLGLAESDVYYPAGKPQDVLDAAELTSTTSFDLSLSSDYNARPYSNSSEVRLDVRASGASCVITSTNRSFVEGTKARITKELERTMPRLLWLESIWFVTLTVAILMMTLWGTFVFALSRLVPGDRTFVTVISFAVYVVALIVVQVFIQKHWYQQFPRVEVVQVGSKSKAELAAMRLRKASGWILTVIAIPVLLGIFLGT